MAMRHCLLAKLHGRVYARANPCPPTAVGAPKLMYTRAPKVTPSHGDALAAVVLFILLILAVWVL